MEAWTFPFYCSSPHCRRLNRICMAFPLQVTSSLLSFTVFLCHLLLLYHTLSIISPPFHHPPPCTGKTSGPCTHTKLKESCIFKRREIWDPRLDIICGILHKQNVCTAAFDVCAGSAAWVVSYLKACMFKTSSDKSLTSGRGGLRCMSR